VWDVRNKKVAWREEYATLEAADDKYVYWFPDPDAVARRALNGKTKGDYSKDRERTRVGDRVLCRCPSVSCRRASRSSRSRSRANRWRMCSAVRTE